MFGPKIKLDKDLQRKVKMYAEEFAEISVEEFVTKALQREVDRLEAESKG